jgi:hypothetical protein
MSTLVGRLDRSPVDGFSLASGQTFDIVGTGDGLTNGLTSLSLDGRACAAEGGGAFKRPLQQLQQLRRNSDPRREVLSARGSASHKRTREAYAFLVRKRSRNKSPRFIESAAIRSRLTGAARVPSLMAAGAPR